MAIYCYSRGNDTVEMSFPTGHAPKTVVHRNRTYERDFGAEGVSVPASTWNTPIHCVASGVAPSQAQELRDHFRRCGVKCEVDNDGNPVYTSAAQRRRALKCRGLKDRSAFY